MPRKSKKNQEKEQNPVNTTPPVVVETEAPITPEVKPVVEVLPEVTPVSEVITQPEIEIQHQSPTHLFQSGLEEPKEVEIAKAEKKGLSQKEMFEKAIEIKPFTIFQNGILVCHHSDFVKITVADKYFEINFRKFSYEGIEIKYI